jgi:hypothetical protein
MDRSIAVGADPPGAMLLLALPSARFDADHRRIDFMGGVQASRVVCPDGERSSWIRWLIVFSTLINLLDRVVLAETQRTRAMPDQPRGPS